MVRRRRRRPALDRGPLAVDPARVLPPQPEAPGEDLLSLIFFYETNHDAVIESLPAPIGRTQFPPVVAHEYLKDKLDAITVT